MFTRLSWLYLQWHYRFMILTLNQCCNERQLYCFVDKVLWQTAVEVRVRKLPSTTICALLTQPAVKTTLQPPHISGYRTVHSTFCQYILPSQLEGFLLGIRVSWNMNRLVSAGNGYLREGTAGCAGQPSNPNVCLCQDAPEQWFDLSWLEHEKKQNNVHHWTHRWRPVQRPMFEGLGLGFYSSPFHWNKTSIPCQIKALFLHEGC